MSPATEAPPQSATPPATPPPPAPPKNPNGWVGVDLDGTLAHYEGWQGPEHIGEPVPIMLNRVQQWLKSGLKIKLVTARAADIDSHVIIHAWLLKHGLPVLEVTDRKDFNMLWLWDDRAVAVATNTGLSHMDHQRLMVEDVKVLGQALGIPWRHGVIFHNYALHIFDALAELEALVDAAANALDHIRSDRFRGGDDCQAFKDLCAARLNLRQMARRLEGASRRGEEPKEEGQPDAN